MGRRRENFILHCVLPMINMLFAVLNCVIFYHTSVTSIEIFSGGVASQFKQRFSLCHLTNEASYFDKKMTWNFFAKALNIQSTTESNHGQILLITRKILLKFALTTFVQLKQVLIGAIIN